MGNYPLASKQKFLKNLGITVWVSAEAYIQLCDDKLSFYKAWQNSPVSPIPTYKRLSAQISGRWVVKEKTGSGSKSLGLNLSSSDAIAYSRKLESPIYQPYISGREFTAETWIDQKGKIHGVLLRWRNKVIRGESHNSTVFKNEEWAKKDGRCISFAYGCLWPLLSSGYRKFRRPASPRGNQP